MCAGQEMRAGEGMRAGQKIRADQGMRAGQEAFEPAARQAVRSPATVST